MVCDKPGGGRLEDKLFARQGRKLVMESRASTARRQTQHRGEKTSRVATGESKVGNNFGRRQKVLVLEANSIVVETKTATIRIYILYVDRTG